MPTLTLENSFIFNIYGGALVTNSAHHQAVKELGTGLEAVQYSKDGLVEAFYHTRLPIYAVQWHPERMCLKNARTDTVDGLKVFAYFVNGILNSYFILIRKSADLTNRFKTDTILACSNGVIGRRVVCETTFCGRYSQEEDYIYAEKKKYV